MSFLMSVLLFLSPSPESQPVPGTKLPQVTLEAGSSSGITKAGCEIVTTDARWQKLWRSHKSNMHPVPDAPDVDFTNEMVVAVFLGERATGGYGIKVTKVERIGRATYVHYTTFSRGGGGGGGGVTTQALTQPHHLVKVPRHGGPVYFIETKVSR